MIFESDANLIAGENTGIMSISRKINIYNSIGENIKTKREYLEFQKKQIIWRVTSLKETIAELDASIADIVEEVNKINYEVVETKKQIDVQKKTIALLKKKIENNTQVLIEYIIYMYKKWDYVSSDDEIDAIKTVFLSGEDVWKIVNELHYQGIIQTTGQRLLDNHRSYVSQLYVKQLELQNDEAKLKQLRKSGLMEKNLLDDKRASKERLLEITQGKEALYQKYIAEKLTIEKNIKMNELKEQMKLNNAREQLLEKYGCDFVDLSQDTVEAKTIQGECRDINKIIYAESRLREFDTSNNPFTWPINPVSGISAFFRDEEYRFHLNTDHDAIDIVAPQGTEVRSPQDGYIVYIEPPVTNDYSYVAIKHGSDMVTVYGHLSEIKKELYDFVKAWEVFALSWWEYGTKWAGFLTTWPHLHFGLYEEKEYSDPLKFLDISVLPYADIPESYKYKYKADFKKRKWYEFDTSRTDGKWIFNIVWDTEIERQEYLLNTYAVGPFRDWSIWVEESIDAGIDPTFTMCIGLAETTLWKYLKTPYNIWNVWNTDSWAVKSFPNARSWIYAMVSTLNNKYLSQYDEIQDLSRYGNKNPNKPIYASSEYNWHNNITKCMSHIKGEYVPDDYNFRLPK